MKAIIYTKYGSPDVLQLKEVEKPAPKDDEVLVKIHAASVNAHDWHLLTADIFLVRLMGGGLFKPKNTILGADIAGRVEAVGATSSSSSRAMRCSGISPHQGGGFAEYVLFPKMIGAQAIQSCVRASRGRTHGGTHRPAGSARQGANPAGAKGVDSRRVRRGGDVCGADRQIFRGRSHRRVQHRNLDQARSIGADHVIDYTKEDFTKNGQQYDLILAANGYHPLSEYKRALRPRAFTSWPAVPWPRSSRRCSWGHGCQRPAAGKWEACGETKPKDLAFMKELLEAGKVVPVIDRRYPLSETAEALRYLGEGHARGKVVITVENSSKTKQRLAGDPPFRASRAG